VAHDLANNLRMARATAISRSRATGLAFDVNERRYMTEVDNRAVQLPRDLTLTVTSARQFMRGSSETRLVFFPDGSSSGGNIVVERQRQTIEIGVDWLTGQARVGGRR
jgi:general secretion pathway protein H